MGDKQSLLDLEGKSIVVVVVVVVKCCLIGIDGALCLFCYLRPINFRQ